MLRKCWTTLYLHSSVSQPHVHCRDHMVAFVRSIFFMPYFFQMMIRLTQSLPITSSPRMKWVWPQVKHMSTVLSNNCLISSGLFEGLQLISIPRGLLMTFLKGLQQMTFLQGLRLMGHLHCHVSFLICRNSIPWPHPWWAPSFPVLLLPLRSTPLKVISCRICPSLRKRKRKTTQTSKSIWVAKLGMLTPAFPLCPAHPLETPPVSPVKSQDWMSRKWLTGWLPWVSGIIMHQGVFSRQAASVWVFLAQMKSSLWRILRGVSSWPRGLHQSTTSHLPLIMEVRALLCLICLGQILQQWWTVSFALSWFWFLHIFAVHAFVPLLHGCLLLFPGPCTIEFRALHEPLQLITETVQSPEGRSWGDIIRDVSSQVRLGQILLVLGIDRVGSFITFA